MVAAALASLLTAEGDMEVVGQVSDGLSAIESVGRNAPDILISEVNLPHHSGIEISEHLSKLGSNVKVLILTSERGVGYMQRALAAGALGYLLKYSSAEDLPRAIRQIAAGQRALAAELEEAVRSSPPNPLTARQQAALRLAAEGRSNKQIAELLNLATGTVRNYISEGAQKVGAPNRIEAARIARINGWL
jgi:two-component system response regulator DesR